MAQMLVGATTSDLMLSKDDRNVTLEMLRDSIYADDIQYQMALALQRDHLPPGTAQEYRMLAAQDPDKTFPSIVSSAAQYLSPFGSRAVATATGETTFDLSAIADSANNISVYIVIPPHKLRTHKGLLRAWVGALLYLVMNSHKAGLLFLIDEAAQLGRFSLLEDSITLLRGYGLRTWTFWQDLSQIISLYEKAAPTMINNSGVMQVFGTPNLGAATEIAKTVGFAIEDLLMMAPDEQLVLLKNERRALFGRVNYLTDEPWRTRRQIIRGIRIWSRTSRKPLPA